MVDYPDILHYTREELFEEYCKLFDRFQELHESNESDAQKIHELKRSLDTATAAQAYLSLELDQCANSGNIKTENELYKTQTELVDVKKKFNKLEASYFSLQQDNNKLLEENSKITKHLEESEKGNQQVPSQDDAKVVDDYVMRIQLLENENEDLLQQIKMFEERSVYYTLATAEYEKNIEILTEQITCLEENLKSKRMDLEEKVQIIESTQEQLAEANAKIVALSSTPDNNDRKGNSLFAEVDDQRQEMKHLLSVQKKSYMQMKKIYNESEHEIRRLKRQNVSMRTELEACSAIFCNADKIYQEKLNDRIRNLLSQTDELERKLIWSQERLIELASDKGVLFLDSMLSFCKKEKIELKSQLHRVRLQNASLEQQFRDVQQDMARWRFESLKSRCILIDRENLLTENKITFKPMHAMEYKISEKDQNEAKPRIVSNRRSSILENLANRKSSSPLKVPIKNELNSPQQIARKDNETLIDSNNEKGLISECADDKSSNPYKNEEQISEQECVDKIIKSEIDCSMVKSNETSDKCSISINLCNEDKENSIICLNDTPIYDNFANLKAKPPSPMRPSQNFKTSTTPPVRSILVKNDLLINSSKHVKFSSDDDTVYNMSLEAHSPDKSYTNIKTESVNAATETIISSNNTEKKSRTKSNIVVRRVVISSKHD